MSKPHEISALPAECDDGGQLPGEAALDAARVAAAVVEINRIHTAKGLEAVRDMGRYLLDVFFGGDFEAFRARGRKHVSFRKLEDRPDLHVSASTLWNAVAIVQQLELLPKDIANALPVSHHRLLLPIRSVDSKLELAQRAADKQLTKRQLAEQAQTVRAAETAGKRSGRPPLRAFYKALKAMQRAREQATVGEVEQFHFAIDGTGLQPAELSVLLDELEAGVAELQAVIAAARDKVEVGVLPF